MTKYTKIYTTEHGLIPMNRFVTFWHKSLFDFGYTDLTQKDVLVQVYKIIKRDKDISIIGRFLIDEIDINETKKVNYDIAPNPPRQPNTTGEKTNRNINE